MPTFAFKAINQNKRTVEDTITAATQSDAQALLSGQGYKVLSITEAKEKSKFNINFQRGIPLLERSTLFRYLATMVDAGLSLPEAVEVYAQDSQSGQVKKILFNVQQYLQQGKALSDSLAKYPDIFDHTTLSIIRAGEVSGTLTKSLDYLSRQLYSEYKLKQKVKGAMMYPIVIVTAMATVGMILIFFVLPKIAPIFLQMNVNLPTFSRIILTGGLFISENSLIILSIVFIGLVVLGLSLWLPKGRQAALKIISLIPAIGNLINQIDLARFSRTLSTLMTSGVPIAEALFIVISSLSQSKYRQLATVFQSEVQKGTPLSEIMRLRKKLFPNMVTRMVATGEKTGSVDSMLAELADHYENEIDSTLANFTSILEPILLLLVGIGVGLMVLAVIAPIYSLVGGIESATPGR